MVIKTDAEPCKNCGVTKGYTTTDFWLQFPVYALAGVILYLGWGPEQVTDAFTEIEGTYTLAKEMLSSLFALVAPTVSTMFYVKKRSDVKMKG